MKKTVTAIILCIVMMLGLTACGASEIMTNIRGEAGVRISEKSSDGDEYNAGRPDDVPEADIPMLTPIAGEKLKIEDSKNYDLDNVFIGWTINYPENMPDAMLAKVITMKDGFLPGGDGTSITNLAKANRGEWVSYTVEINCEAFEEGYYSVSADITNNLNDTLRWNKYRFLSCYDAEFNKLTTDDVFEDFFDQRSFILNSITEYWMLSYGSNTNFILEINGETGPLPEEYADEVVSKGSFTLTADSIEFSTSPIGITEKSQGSDEVKTYSAPLSMNFSYAEIGASRLTIFR